MRWLGGCCYPSLGVMWVPLDKALRVRERIQTVLDGTCTPIEYREIIGFLEHVVDIGRFPRELMQHLHNPMRAGGECETNPLGTLEPDGRRDGYLRKWRNLMLNSPGASLLAACEQLPADPAAHATWYLRSDAMLESYGAAMGGCLYGAWWRLPLVRPALTIPVLELLAACVNFVVFASQLQEARQVIMEIDALASPTVLHKDKAKAPGLRAVLAEFRRLPELPHFTNGNRLFCAHCWGEGNPLGDAASRGKTEVIEAIGSALGMRMRQVPIGADGLAFIDRVLLRLDSPPLTHAEREFDSTLGFPGEGPPPTPPSLADLPPPATASPALLAFISTADEPPSPSLFSHPLSPARPLAIAGAEASPPPPLHAAAATPSPPPYTSAETSTSPLPHRRQPPPVIRSSAASPIAAPPSPIAAAFAAASSWCNSFIISTADALSAEETHRSFAAQQCAHTAAERLAPSLLLQLTDIRLSYKVPIPPSASTSYNHPRASATLSQAAQARAAALTNALTSQSATGSLRLAEGEADHLATRLVQLLESAAAANTLKGERSNWRHWLAFCTHRNVDPFRPDVRGMAHTEYDTEVCTLALGLLFIYGSMGKRKGRLHPPRPSSALAVLRGIRRAHARLGVQMADLSMAARLADALNREYIDAHGWEALQVSRVAPLTNVIIAGMLKAECIKGDSVGATATRALWATLAQTGFRKAEVALGSGESFGPSCLTRHNLRWRIGGVETADPTTEQLRAMGESDLAILIPPKSKCDQFGLEWGQAPIYLRFSHSVAICAARELRDLELRLPRNGLTQREGTALFTREDGSPITAANVDKLFKACLAGSGVARSTTAQYSPHSFRRYLACALKAQGAADSTIQALLRWKTAESLKLYSILNDESYADLIDGAGKADVSSVRTNSLPRAELLDVAGNFHAARVSLRSAAAAAEATKPEEDECDADSEAVSSSDSSDAEQSPPTPPPELARDKRKRKSNTAAASLPSRTRSSQPPPPITIDAAVGRHALVPASIWPTYTCSEHDGRGWEVKIRHADKRIRAVLVSFVADRNAVGKRYPKEWLLLESLLPL